MIDAQGLTFYCNGQLVGGIQSYQVFDGNTTPIEHNKLDGSGREKFPGVPNYGSIVLNILRDYADPGQIELEKTRTNRVRVTCVLTPKGGSAHTFPGFARVMPIIGNNNGVTTSRCIVEVAGPVSA